MHDKGKLLLECEECIEDHKKSAETPDCFWCQPQTDKEFLAWKERREAGAKVVKEGRCDG